MTGKLQITTIYNEKVYIEVSAPTSSALLQIARDKAEQMVQAGVLINLPNNLFTVYSPATIRTITFSTDGTVVVDLPPTDIVDSIPPKLSFTDKSLNLWTLSGQKVMVNGFSAAGGLGSQLIMLNEKVYVFGIDSNWWEWTGNVWKQLGKNRPT